MNDIAENKITDSVSSVEERKPRRGHKEVLPNRAFDKEYMTEWYKEVRFLKEHGISPTFIKVKPEFGVRQYKYTKTPELFALLNDFYSQVEYEKEYKKMDRVVRKSTIIPAWATKKLREHDIC